MTPGILRPEEYHNVSGRCRHHDVLHGNSIEIGFARRSETEPRTSDENESQSVATLVASPSPERLIGKHRAQLSGRSSISSTSSYSTQTSSDELHVPIKHLIQYYTSSGSDLDEDILTRRVSYSSTNNNPWLVDAVPPKFQHPLQAHPVLKSRQGSLPPPYQQPDRRHSQAFSEYYRPHVRPDQNVRSGRHLRRENKDIEKIIFILKLCKAFLLFGIQAHRLEEYLHITAAYLKITAEFQYIPHCMLIVLTNPSHGRNEIHLLKESTSVDLGKVEDVYRIYQSVIEHRNDLQSGIRELDMVMRKGKRYTNLLLILLHGLAALCAGTFAFSARPIDFGPIYLLGCFLAILQLLVLRTPIRSSHILEVITSVIVAFAARGLGSVYDNSHRPLFCFSGITQGVIALILPGHVILAATHEIQNRQVLSGSVKMIYAILYTLFLGFGILIGTALYGFIDSNAVSATTCQMPWYWDTLTTRWHTTYAQFVWVPIFALAISIMHHAKRRHLPAMTFIATCGHQAFYWSLRRFAQNLQFAGMTAAFAIGLLANAYAHFSDCLSSTILLPAVLVIIPNALAASGSLVAGVGTANAIVMNGTYSIRDESMNRREELLHLRDFTANGPSGSTGLIITSGIGMAQATIGITVGLFLSALVVYPLTKRKAGSLAF